MSSENAYSRRLESLVVQGKKSEFYAELVAEVEVICQSLGFQEQAAILATLEKLWLPVALNLATARKKLNRTLVQGILGGQGTGKSTLCIILQHILGYLGFSVATLSMDDLYLTYPERQALQQQDPRLVWRGPPGTHDIALGIKIIEQCLQENNTAQILLPRFDKSAFDGAGDRTTPEIIEKPDLLLFEGWFVGVQPLDTDSFNNCPPPIVTEQDRQFARDNNQRLQAYLPLWSKLDSLIVLYPEDYRLSKQWRKEAEHKMIAQGKDGMSDDEIDSFVEYFWKALHPELFILPLTKTADLVVEIKSDRLSFRAIAYL
ncbi:MAG: glycerate kinase [Hyellaceae cyanobacterium CSU_1_1]|nr:glycerate kinase [Hyellaceae cyanobacterium CSU_1_1]